MADITTLKLEPRQRTGTAECRRLRREGVVPGNVYGHGEGSVAVKAREEEVTRLISGGARVIDTVMDGTAQKAIFREVQWDAFGIQVQHFDLIRVSADETVVVEVPIELRGTAPGTMAGGILDQHLHTLEVEASADRIPEVIVVRIGSLDVGEAVHVSDLELPDGVITRLPPEELVVQVTEAMVEPEELEEGQPGALEPEVIGRKQEEEDSEES